MFYDNGIDWPFDNANMVHSWSDTIPNYSERMKWIIINTLGYAQELDQTQ